jgi:hypothetical protein
VGGAPHHAEAEARTGAAPVAVGQRNLKGGEVRGDVPAMAAGTAAATPAGVPPSTQASASVRVRAGAAAALAATRTGRHRNAGIGKQKGKTVVLEAVAYLFILAQQPRARLQSPLGRLLGGDQSQGLVGDGASEQFEQGGIHAEYVAATGLVGKRPPRLAGRGLRGRPGPA